MKPHAHPSSKFQENQKRFTASKLTGNYNKIKFKIEF